MVLFVQPNITAPRSCGWRFLVGMDRFVGLVFFTTWLHEDLLVTIVLILARGETKGKE